MKGDRYGSGRVGAASREGHGTIRAIADETTEAAGMGQGSTAWAADTVERTMANGRAETGGKVNDYNDIPGVEKMSMSLRVYKTTWALIRRINFLFDYSMFIESKKIKQGGRRRSDSYQPTDPSTGLAVAI